MDTSWWVSKDSLDPSQKAFITLPANGRYILTGPAGSGKTNLLVLRAQFVAGSGEKNVLLVTYTNALCDFIRSGVEDLGVIGGDQVQTFHSWATRHIRTYAKQNLVDKDKGFDEETRERAVELLKLANQRIPVAKLYSAIFVDEAQDLTVPELECLLALSDNVCVCGDIKQGIYHRDGLDIASHMNLDPHQLTRHYRIGHRIARVADRLLPPASPEESLEATSNYNPKLRGASSAELHHCASRDDQFDRMLERIRVQLVAFSGERIGVLCGRRNTADDVYERFMKSDLASGVVLHDGDSQGFGGEEPIHIMTMHSAKGVEFRSVHLFGIEDLRGGHLSKPTLAFTAVTRAKTSLNAYCTGKTSPEVEAAFAEPKVVELDDLFPRKK